TCPASGSTIATTPPVSSDTKIRGPLAAGAGVAGGVPPEDVDSRLHAAARTTVSSSSRFNIGVSYALREVQVAKDSHDQRTHYCMDHHVCRHHACRGADAATDVSGRRPRWRTNRDRLATYRLSDATTR